MHAKFPHMHAEFGFLPRSHRIVVPVLHNSTGPVYMACPTSPALPPEATLAAAAVAGCLAPDLAEGAAFELNNALPYLMRVGH